jgi:hypothetical protein
MPPRFKLQEFVLQTGGALVLNVDGTLSAEGEAAL